MTKTFIGTFFLSCTLSFAVACTAAIADPASDARPELTVSHPHNYWLSDGLNRMVFWQPPLQTGRSVAKSDPHSEKK